MNSGRPGLFTSMLAVVASWAANGRAWAQSGPGPAMPPSATTAQGEAGGGTAIAAVVVILSLLVVIGLAVKLFDLKRKRESETVQLQAQVSDALLREPALAGLPLTPTAHVPMWTGTPATIEVTGQVPTPEVKETALRLVRDEAVRIRSDVKIEDRLSVIPSTRAA